MGPSGSAKAHYAIAQNNAVTTERSPTIRDFVTACENLNTTANGGGQQNSPTKMNVFAAIATALKFEIDVIFLRL